MSITNMHLEYCCLEHGCRYGDEECPVGSGIIKQTHPCDECEGSHEQTE